MCEDVHQECLGAAHHAKARQRHLDIGDALAHYYGCSERPLSQASLEAAEEALRTQQAPKVNGKVN
jgi:hypothetical protein